MTPISAGHTQQLATFKHSSLSVCRRFIAVKAEYFALVLNTEEI